MGQRDTSDTSRGNAPGETDETADERRLRLILANVADVVLEIDPDNTYRWVSPSVQDILGWDPDELVGKSAADLVHPGDLPMLLHVREHPIQGVARATVRFRTSRGLYRWFSGQSREVRDQGRLLGRVVTMRDVHEEIVAKEALAASQAKYRLLAENANDLVLAGDNQGRVTWVSDSVSDVLGWGPEDLVGVTVRHLVHPEDLPVVIRVQDGVLAGKPGSMRIRVRNAADEYRWFECLVKPLFDDAGVVIGRVSGWRDVQEEQAALDALQASEEQFRLIAESLGDIVLRTSRDHEVTWVSPGITDLTGWEVDEVVGHPAWDFVHPDELVPLRSAMAQLQAGITESESGQVRLVRKDGTYRSWALNARRPIAERGDIVATLRDVDAEVRAREEANAQQAQRIALVESMLDPHIVLEVVREEGGEIAEFVYSDVNAAACEYLRQSPDELVGRPLREVVTADEYAALFPLLSQTMRTGDPLVVDGFAYPQRESSELGHLDVRGVKVGDSISFSWRDVTERIEAQDRLAEAEMHYRSLVDDAADAIVAADSTGRITFASLAVTAMVGWDPDDLVGTVAMDLVHPDDVAGATAARSALFAEGRGQYRARLRCRDGTYCWVEANIHVLTGPDGSVEGTTAVWRDVDVEVRARQEVNDQASRRAAVMESMLDPHVLLQAVRDEPSA